ncbi:MULTISPECIES: hypothetical protein [Candidatus Ichthyocystis]|uniref:Putative membrane protein n=1 Tax=Candidatus Ichthyocystis hellenicum TaxID=1561003 RepID=A0A0S4M304_9BURK|nr:MULTISPECIES: hypothetical protein [Ichthyocystis]CUT17114.1 putative membrane protein [Candidatus Ichthyocystis hellenicum]
MEQMARLLGYGVREQSGILPSQNSNDHALCDVICETPSTLPTTISSFPTSNGNIMADGNNSKPRLGGIVSKIFLALSFSYATLCTILYSTDSSNTKICFLFLVIGAICFSLFIAGHTYEPVNRIFRQLEAPNKTKING